MAIDQNARFGLGVMITSCTSSPLTPIDFAVGTGQPGWATTYHVMSVLKTSAAQYGGRIRHARRRAYFAMPPRRHPARAGPIDRENPDSTMKTMTANRP